MQSGKSDEKNGKRRCFVNHKYSPDADTMHNVGVLAWLSYSVF